MRLQQANGILQVINKVDHQRRTLMGLYTLHHRIWQIRSQNENICAPLTLKVLNF